MAIKKIKRPNPKWDIILEKLKDFFFKFIKKSKKLCAIRYIEVINIKLISILSSLTNLKIKKYNAREKIKSKNIPLIFLNFGEAHEALGPNDINNSKGKRNGAKIKL